MLTSRRFDLAPLIALAALPPLRTAIGHDLLPRPLVWPLLVWTALLVMALLIGTSLAPEAAWTRGWAYIYGLCVIGGVYNLAQIRPVRPWLAPAWFTVSLVIGAAGFYLMASNVANKIPLLTSLFARIAGDSVFIQNSFRTEEGLNPNVLGGTLLPALFMPAAYVAYRRSAGEGGSRLRMGLAVAAGLFLLAVLTLTQSRGGYLGFLAGAVAFILLTNKRLGLIALGVGALLAMAFVVITSLAGLDWRVFANGRMELWARGWRMLLMFPLTGVGLNLFAPVSELFFPEFLGGDPSVIHAHNMFLQVMLDFGVLGLAVLVWTLTIVWRDGLRALRDATHSRRNPSDLALAWTLRGLLAGQAAWLVFNLTDFANLGSKQGFLFWAAWGLIIGLAHARRTDHETV